MGMRQGEEIEAVGLVSGGGRCGEERLEKRWLGGGSVARGAWRGGCDVRHF